MSNIIFHSQNIHTLTNVIGVMQTVFYALLKLKLSNYVPHRSGGGDIVFGADPVGVGVSVGVGVTLSCLHDIS